ncbi:hypothetical protein B4589_009785 [Halolamina sp. CBA1230]|uniref:hypothetical protein n=1 Tax=Halolamina sp. CBA1230 TaxID=1853690 RepID=UPI00117AABCE|nr:hypothetical protein [Halolamina sp. CBA1230]QKY20655.1 hypothetical protein B4589_009785 [Halolamina sp. CBA1230]
MKTVYVVVLDIGNGSLVKGAFADKKEAEACAFQAAKSSNKGCDDDLEIVNDPSPPKGVTQVKTASPATYATVKAYDLDF